MDRGWGVTFGGSSDKVGYYGKNPVFGFDSGLDIRGKPLMMFPVSSTGRDENNAAVYPPRHTVGEVDFFAETKRTAVKKEESLQEDFSNCREGGVNTGLQLLTANSRSDQSTVDDGISSDLEEKRAKNELVQLQVELERMNVENQRLKGMLTQVTNNYSALQMHLLEVMQQQRNSKHESTQELKSDEKKSENGSAQRNFLDLATTAAPMADDQSNSSSGERTLLGSPQNKKRSGRDESPESESWAPNKATKMNPATPVEQPAEATMRKARVSVRARSEAAMISDGCQWRKYGQKMAKGNPCPRAYYRCTMTVGCPVRKQVQRCAEDRTILITTYEGSHNHPLPPAAMSMASTTSAAANMLLSGAMPSADGMMAPNILARTVLPCSSNMATISASAPFPTVTLDLTQTPNPHQFQQPPPQFQSPFAIPPPHQAGPQVFGHARYNQSRFTGSQMSQEFNYPAQIAHPSFSDTISAATAAITADPNFTAALAAAISSIIGGGQPINNAAPTPNAHDVNTSNSNKISGSFPGN